MVLPFSEKSTPQPKFTCFVCGHEAENREEFISHIIEKHDEGREYIKCTTCGAPVRDVKTHYFAQHPGYEVQKGQQKALIWRDFSKNKKKTKKPKFKDGHLVSLKNDMKPMHYRSSWELKVYECLEELNEVSRYEVESIAIPYYWDGKWHKYYPDLVIQFIDGHTEVWEIKPLNQTEIEKNQVKWKACYNYCSNLGYRFIVQTERGIKNLVNRVIRESKKNS